MTLPMLIFWAILLGVVVVLLGAFSSHRHQGEALGVMGSLMVAAIVVFATGMTAGFLLTRLSSPTPEAWWWAASARAVWQVGGAVGLGTMIFVEGRPKGAASSMRWVVIPVLATLGIAASYAPLRDLSAGPLTLRGAIHLEVRKANRVRAGRSIVADLRLKTAEGGTYELDLSGLAASQAEALLRGCEDQAEVELVLLEHLERVIGARCW